MKKLVLLVGVFVTGCCHTQHTDLTIRTFTCEIKLSVRSTSAERTFDDQQRTQANSSKARRNESENVETD